LPDPALSASAGGRVLPLPDFYRLRELPVAAAVLGSGAVAVELALLLALLGVQTALVAREPALLPQLDGDLGSFALRRLRRAGVTMHLGRTIAGESDAGIQLDDGTGVRAGFVLHADRRLPRREAWADLGLAEREGFLKVDRFGRTSQPDLYAVGDLVGGSMMANAASAQAMAAVDHIAGRATSVDLERVPVGVYLDPELATVGASEELLRKRGISYRASRFALAANSKALIADEVDGFVKVLADTAHGEVLGVHIAASNATDLVAEAALAIRFGLTADELAAVVHPHPAFSESVVEAARG
jgi:dihydrolipoamide dehydrogenase